MGILILDPFGGMAGDMLLAALLDLGDERFRLDDLEALARALVPGESRLLLEETRRGSLRAKRLAVHTPDAPDPPHRRLSDLLGILDRAPLGAAARRRAQDVLAGLARAEARVHGSSVEEVHFHEVGAVDTLIDAAGAALALEKLGVERVHSTPPTTGQGTLRCAHGILPIPAPGTAELLGGLPTRRGGGGSERVTPTGAALLAALVDEFAPPEAFRSRAVGYGAGERDPEDGPPNLLRVELGEASCGGASRRSAWLLAFNLDDATGEEVGFCLERLRGAGALEAWSQPVQMKKDRPGVVVSALCREDLRSALEGVAFEASPTLGVRWSRLERTECAREEVLATVEGREVRVKVRRRPGSTELLAPDLSPEYDDLAALARATGLPLRELEGRAIGAARAALRRPG